MDIIYDDSSLERGFINKNKILEYLTEEEIFGLVFDYVPEEFEYITSPFREDKNPGCWFERDIITGKLWFKDFANNATVRGIKMRIIDCFNAVQVYYNFSNFYKTLQFIKRNLIDNKNRKIREVSNFTKMVNNTSVIKKSRTKISIATKDFTSKDRKYWTSYGISKRNLIDDEVFSVKKFRVDNPRKNKNVVINGGDLCFAYTQFEKNRKKIYRPLLKRGKFITNCSADDIGGITDLVPFGRKLVISKSYKDYRVLKNFGLNVIWFQNEGMFPSKHLMEDLISRFKEHIIFFDNDRGGIEAAEKLLKLINNKSLNKARSIHLSVELIKYGITDPSDYYKKVSKKKLVKFLKESNLL